MSISLPVAASRVARAIQSTERSLDQALRDSSCLMCELATIRLGADVEASAAQVAFVRLAKAQSLLVEAQTEALRSHAALRDFARERADVPDECPENFFVIGQAAA